MRYDQYSRLIFNDQDIFDIIYNQDLDKLNLIIAEDSSEITALKKLSNIKIQTNKESNISLEEFDTHNQKKWLMPDEYKKLDIEKFLVHVCPKPNYQRLIDEINEYKSRNLLDLLRWLKYFVDTCRKENIVWGVGRGSSVASYALFLIGVHKIDSIKYNLDYKEFLR